ncbi:unnamed protein product, partial [Mycena citricolor]
NIRIQSVRQLLRCVWAMSQQRLGVQDSAGRFQQRHGCSEDIQQADVVGKIGSVNHSEGRRSILIPIFHPIQLQQLHFPLRYRNADINSTRASEPVECFAKSRRFRCNESDEERLLRVRHCGSKSGAPASKL